MLTRWYGVREHEEAQKMIEYGWIRQLERRKSEDGIVSYEIKPVFHGN